MRRLLAFVALVSFLPTANAQDKGKAEFSPSAEFRARYTWTQNPGGIESNENMIQDRMKFGANYKANEKFSAHATALHAATMGQSVNTEEVGNTNTNETDNVLMVNEAYINWMLTDDISFKIGRQNYQIGDGSLIAVNDWEQNPTAFEGLVANWEAEFGRFQLIGFKQRELGTSSGAKDGEHNLYGLNFDLKTMPNWFKALNVHVLKDNQDAIAAATGIESAKTLNGLDVVRYGAMASFNFAMLDFKANYEGTAGKIKSVAAGPGAVTKTDAKGMMWQAEVGAKFDGFMGSRLFVGYHQDSGAKNKAGDAYDPFFYEKHDNAGLMDLVDWGNLTYLTVGWTLKPGDNTDAGIMWHNFTRTEKGALAGDDNGDHNVFKGKDATKDDIGNEIDVWAEHRYDGGLSTVFRVGYFMAGDYLKTAGGKTDEDILQVMVEGKLTF